MTRNARQNARNVSMAFVSLSLRMPERPKAGWLCLSLRMSREDTYCPQDLVTLRALSKGSAEHLLFMSDVQEGHLFGEEAASRGVRNGTVCNLESV